MNDNGHSHFCQKMNYLILGLVFALVAAEVGCQKHKVLLGHRFSTMPYQTVYTSGKAGQLIS